MVELKRLCFLLLMVIGVPAFLALVTFRCQDPISVRRRIDHLKLLKLEKALNNYASDCGGYPPPGSSLDILITNRGVKGWTGPYIKETLEPCDTWGHLFRYRFVDGRPEIVSAGPDGLFGTADDASIRFSGGAEVTSHRAVKNP